MARASRDSMVAKRTREKSIVTRQEELREAAQNLADTPLDEKVSESTRRHKLVADALMEGHTETDALRAAGYHPTSAASVVRHEEVQQFLAKARREVEDKTTIRKFDVLNIFMEAIDMARTLADPANMINGADKVAKMLGYYAPETKRIELTTDQATLSSKLKQLSDAELLEMAAGRMKTIDAECEVLA